MPALGEVAAFDDLSSVGRALSERAVKQATQASAVCASGRREQTHEVPVRRISEVAGTLLNERPIRYRERNQYLSRSSHSVDS